MSAHHDREQLREIEHGLEVSDPELAGMLSRFSDRPGGSATSSDQPTVSARGSHKRAVVVMAVYAVGAMVIALGAVVAYLPLIFMGILLVCVGACLHVTAGGGAGQH